MIALLLPVLLLMSANEPGASSVSPGNRVYFAPLEAGPGTERGILSVFEQRLLSSARRHSDVQVVGAQDVQSLLDHEATRQQGGCDEGGIACAAELAGALDAPRMLTGQLGRVGSRWVLSLTLIERGTLNVVGRSSRQRKGDTPEDLLDDIDAMLDEIFGAARGASSAGQATDGAPWGTAGVVGLGVGGAGLVVGAAALATTWINYNSAVDAIRRAPSASAAAAIREDATARGVPLNIAAVAGLAGGATFAVVGGVIVVLAGQEEP